MPYRISNSSVWNNAADFYDCQGQLDLEMLNEQRLATLSERFSDLPVSGTLDIRTIIKECIEIPTDVASAEFTSVNERVIDQRLLSILLSQSASERHDSDWVVRQRCRKSRLSRYLGEVLICVFIRLPGVQYTIEVDPELKRIVHWEWL